MVRALAVFDMDETLINSDFIWLESAVSFMKEKGIPMDVDVENLFYEKGFGAVVSLIRECIPSMSEEDVFSSLSVIAEEGYRTKATVKEGAFELIGKMRSLGYVPVILTANNPRLSKIIRERFDFPVDRWFSTRELGIGKGDVHVYDLIASSYGLRAEDTVLFDDGEYALKAALDGGLKAIRVYSRKEASRAEVKCPTLMELTDFRTEMLS